MQLNWADNSSLVERDGSFMGRFGSEEAGDASKLFLETIA